MMEQSTWGWDLEPWTSLKTGHGNSHERHLPAVDSPSEHAPQPHHLSVIPKSHRKNSHAPRI